MNSFPSWPSQSSVTLVILQCGSCTLAFVSNLLHISVSIEKRDSFLSFHKREFLNFWNENYHEFKSFEIFRRHSSALTLSTKSLKLLNGAVDLHSYLFTGSIGCMAKFLFRNNLSLYRKILREGLATFGRAAHKCELDRSHFGVVKARNIRFQTAFCVRCFQTVIKNCEFVLRPAAQFKHRSLQRFLKKVYWQFIYALRSSTNYFRKRAQHFTFL